MQRILVRGLAAKRAVNWASLGGPAQCHGAQRHHPVPSRDPSYRSPL